MSVLNYTYIRNKFKKKKNYKIVLKKKLKHIIVYI